MLVAHCCHTPHRICEIPNIYQDLYQNILVYHNVFPIHSYWTRYFSHDNQSRHSVCTFQLEDSDPDILVEGSQRVNAPPLYLWNNNNAIGSVHFEDTSVEEGTEARCDIRCLLAIRGDSLRSTDAPSTYRPVTHQD